MPMYKSPIRSLNERAPASDSISGVASQYGDPLEQAAYLRGRMKAQEFIQKRQDVETTQSRLMATQDEAERRNAAREELAQNRFEQAQKEAAARAAFQEDQQARILDQQQWERKFNMQKETAAEERARLKAEADAKKEIDKQAADAAKLTRDEQEKSAFGEVSGLLLSAGMDVENPVVKGLSYSYVRANPEQRRGILKYIQETADYNAQKKKDAAASEVLAAIDFTKVGNEWRDKNKTVWVDKDPGEGITPAIVPKSSLDKNPSWKEISSDASRGYMIGGKPAMANLPPPKWGGLIDSETNPAVPNSGTPSPMAPPPAAAPVVASPAAIMDQNIVTRTLKDGTTVRVRRTANGWEEVE